MLQSPASGDQDFVHHSSKDPLTTEPDTAAHYSHASPGDSGKDGGYVQVGDAHKITPIRSTHLLSILYV